MFSRPILLDQVQTQVSVNYYQTSQFLRMFINKSGQSLKPAVSLETTHDNIVKVLLYYILCNFKHENQTGRVIID